MVFFLNYSSDKCCQRIKCNGWIQHCICGHPWLNCHWPKWFKFIMTLWSSILSIVSLQEIILNSSNIWIMIMMMFAITNPVQVCNMNNFISFFPFFSILQLNFHIFYALLYIFICPHFLILTFVCNWFGPLFVEYATLFTTLKGRKQCWPLSFLFQDGANVVT